MLYGDLKKNCEDKDFYPADSQFNTKTIRRKLFSKIPLKIILQNSDFNLAFLNFLENDKRYKQSSLLRYD